MAASAEPLVLAILQRGPSYGYAIIQQVRELSGGALEWSEGMLYPVLHRLEDQGLITATWCAMSLAVLALLVPWQRGELSRAGWAVACWAIAYGGAGTINLLASTWPEDVLTWIPTIAALAIVVAALGTVLRARWAVVPGALAAAGMAWSTFALLAFHPRHPSFPDGLRVYVIVMSLLGIGAAGAATWLARDGARRDLGDLRSLLA